MTERGRRAAALGVYSAKPSAYASPHGRRRACLVAAFFALEKLIPKRDSPVAHLLLTGTQSYETSFSYAPPPHRRAGD